MLSSGQRGAKDAQEIVGSVQSAPFGTEISFAAAHSAR